METPVIYGSLRGSECDACNVCAACAPCAACLVTPVPDIEVYLAWGTHLTIKVHAAW